MSDSNELTIIRQLLSAFRGKTTAVGAVDGSTLICSQLIGKPDVFTGKRILLLSGVDAYDLTDISTFDNVTGTITVSPVFLAQVGSGVYFGILNDEATALALTAIAAQISAAQADISKIRTAESFTELWGTIIPTTTITTVAADKVLGNLIVNNIPAAATIIWATMRIRGRAVQNTNAAANNIAGAQQVQAQKDVGGAYIDGIDVPDLSFNVPLTSLAGQFNLEGQNNISAQMPAIGSQMDFKWALAKSAQNNLLLLDVQCGVKIWWKV